MTCCAGTRAAARPSRNWVTDLTEHPTAEGKVYCCATQDLFSNRIVGNALSIRTTVDIAVATLLSALARREPDGVVTVQADRASELGACNFQAVLVAAGHQGSMGRVDSAGDNTNVKSF
jgi:transposase InsO family protein